MIRHLIRWIRWHFLGTELVLCTCTTCLYNATRLLSSSYCLLKCVEVGPSGLCSCYEKEGADG